MIVTNVFTGDNRIVIVRMATGGFAKMALCEIRIKKGAAILQLPDFYPMACFFCSRTTPET